MSKIQPCKHGKAIRRCNECKRIHNRAYQKKYHKTIHGRAVMLYNSARIRAKSKRITFNLPLSWVEDRLQIGVCELTGRRFSEVSGEPGAMRTSHSPSIDRIDSNVGYEPNNCRMILWALNSAFSFWGEKEFQSIVEDWLNE